MLTTNIRSRLGLALLVLLAPAVAYAHPGHGLPGGGFIQGFAHPLSGLDHVLMMVGVGVFAARLGGRALWAVPLTFVAVMVVGGILGFRGVGVPLVEVMIALSVVVIGVAVAAGRRLPVAAAMAIVGICALFHGHAHGTGMAHAPSALSYAAGFVCATGLLHVLGIGLGVGIGRLGAVRAQRLSRITGTAVAAAGLALLASMG